METKRHYNGHHDRIDGGPLPLPDVTEAKIFVFLAITELMRHCIRDKVTDYWANNYTIPRKFLK